jgi:hypothetical protein
MKAKQLNKQAQVPQQLKIGQKQVAEAQSILEKYKKGKVQLDTRIVDNEQWYKQRHWDQVAGENTSNKPRPASGWLFNCILNKHADAMDNYPEPNVLPREEGDKGDAKILSSILPVILEHNDYESTYSDAWWDKLKFGTSCYGIFWNKDLEGGLGDIDIKHIDILNLFWTPGINDLQDSKHLFHVQLIDNDTLVATYPQLKDKLGHNAISEKTSEYLFDDQVDTSEMSPVVDWYYKVKTPLDVGYKEVVHLVKYCNGEVLYATENTPEVAESGIYDHAKYPFIFDRLFVTKGTPTGFGYIDAIKAAQMDIDKLNQIILMNAYKSGNPKIFVSESVNMNMEDYTDPDKQIIRVPGQVDDTRIKQEQVSPLPSFIIDYQQYKIDELKEVSGNRDFSQGGTSSGVTAASAIAALQEAGSKLSRDMIKESYNCEKQKNYMILELIRQFYSEPRSFRITGEKGMEEFIQYSNQGLNPMTMELGIESTRRPVFDIKITSQKASPFSKIAQNELAKELYGAGVFNPQFADQALAMIGMMDFEGKDLVEQKISQNGTMFQQLQMMQAQLQQMAMLIDAQNGSSLSQAIGTNSTGQSAPVGADISSGVSRVNSLGTAVKGASNVTANTARDKAMSVAKPN